MESMDFSSTNDILQTIPEEKKIDEPQMMEFSSSVADLVPPTQDTYINPTNQRVSGLSLPNEPVQPTNRKSQNPFNLTDDQLNALIAGIVAVVLFSSTVQGKMSGFVPNFTGINGNIANVIVGAVLFYFAHRFIKNR
jgi:hypothetical protein